MPNQLSILPNAGLFFGQFSDNVPHKHYALQITLSLGKPFTVHFKDGVSVETQGICIASQTEHCIEQTNGQLLLILIDPVSRAGLALKRFMKRDVCTEKIPAQQILESLATKWQKKQLSQQVLEQHYQAFCQTLIHTYPLVDGIIDPRINQVLEHIEATPNKLRSINEVAALVHLSPDRFRHLFRQQTGNTFTRMQLWYKLLAAFKLIGDRSNLSEIAYGAGFADSAHLSRTFKETFGLTPAQLLKNSRSVQA